MVRVPLPLVVDEYFFLSGKTEDTLPLHVGSPEWYSWLANTEHRSFSLRSYAGGFTARHEQQRHGWYWYAYRKRAGKSYKMYLGKTEDVTRERLYEVAKRLASKGEEKAESASRAQSVYADYSAADKLKKTAKFSVPSIETTIIPRPQLLSLLETGRKSRLLLLSAQAGWGKTVLLANWSELLSRQNIPFAWISLDSADNDPVAFWSALITAVQILQPGLGQKSWSLLHATSEVSFSTVKQTLLDECMSLAQESIIFLDNAQHLTSPESLNGLTFLLERLPSQLHLVMASRNEPSLPLAKLRVEGKLLEIHHANLAFSVPEIEALLREMLQAPLSTQEVTFLAQQTEGWAAGVHLAAHFLKDQPEGAKGIEYFSGSTRALYDYIVEEVLLQQPSPVQDFLLQTSLLPELSSVVCDAVCVNNTSQAMLSYLRHNNLFITPVDTQELRYRYHPLFQEALQEHLRQQRPSLEAELQQRMLLWQKHHPTSYNQKKRTSLEQWAEQSPDGAKTASLIAQASQPIHLLTDRERDVLALLLRGASNREIAQNLIISEGTTKKHIANICSKFNVQRRTQVITSMLEHASL